MSTLDSLPARILLRNGALLIIPPMVITFGLWGALPAAYGPDLFSKDIPKWLGLFENIFRVLVLSLPGILYFGKKETGQPLGWSLYLGDCWFILQAIWRKSFIQTVHGVRASLVLLRPLGQLHFGLQASG